MTAMSIFDSRIGLKAAFRQIGRTFDINGRATRSELISYWIVAVLTGVAFGWLLAITALVYEPIASVSETAQLIWVIALIAPWPALLARRLHDQNRSGWWAAVLLLTLALLSLTPDAIAGRPVTGAEGLELVLGMFVSIAHIVISFAPGTHGPNRFGPDPRLDPLEQ